MDIHRDIIDRFKQWKESPDRKPMLLEGARQIGKTWAVHEFGRQCYEYCATFDFDRNPELAEAFKASKDPARVVKELEFFCGSPLLPGKTLLFFDEIQECEEAYNSLKYFCEEAPEYHIIAAGSLLGVAVRKKNMKVPVGKVDVVKMYPISFKEFLRAEDPKTYDYINGIEKPAHLPIAVFNRLTEKFRRYHICGGMPEAVSALIDGKGTTAVDNILHDIIRLYEFDFSKYATPQEVTRIRAVWQSLPSQLSKENRKFIYKVIKTGARAKEYEDALTWLKDAGMVYQVFNVSKPGIPLKGYAEMDAFKIYACDCGILRRLAGVKPDVILNTNSGYSEFKGAMAENTVLQSIVSQTGPEMPFYWTSGNQAEIEFLVELGADIIPIEVKAKGNLSGRSLSVYTQKYAPSKRIRFSMNNLQENGGLYSIPNPMADWMVKLVCE